MEKFQKPVYSFWNGKNLANNDDFTHLADQITAENNSELHCEISSETTPSYETE